MTILRDALIREGITLHEGIEVVAARLTSPGVELELRGNAGTVLVQGLTPETLGALIGLAVLSLAAIPLKAQFAKSKEVPHANPSRAEARSAVGRPGAICTGTSIVWASLPAIDTARSWQKRDQNLCISHPLHAAHQPPEIAGPEQINLPRAIAAAVQFRRQVHCLPGIGPAGNAAAAIEIR